MIDLTSAGIMGTPSLMFKGQDGGVYVLSQATDYSIYEIGDGSFTSMGIFSDPGVPAPQGATRHNGIFYVFTSSSPGTVYKCESGNMTDISPGGGVATVDAISMLYSGRIAVIDTGGTYPFLTKLVSGTFDVERQLGVTLGTYGLSPFRDDAVVIGASGAETAYNGLYVYDFSDSSIISHYTYKDITLVYSKN